MDVYSFAKPIVVATALFFLAGCATAPPLITASPTPTSTPLAVLSSLPDTAPIPTTRMITNALSSLVDSADLGDHVGVAVADANSGTIIYVYTSAGSTDQFIPASAVKLFTASAVLSKDNPEELVKFAGKDFSLTNLVEITLTESDNRGAALLATLVPGSVANEISLALPTMDMSKTVLLDASGLSRNDRTTPSTLVHLLALIADPNHPQLSPILSGLPISGLSGTLKRRALVASGQIRAKTGTLTGVDVLAGYLVDKAKRTLAFAIMADRVPRTERARAKIDEIAIALLNLS